MSAEAPRRGSTYSPNPRFMVDSSQPSSGYSSPLRPPVSPITPVATFAQLCTSSTTHRRSYPAFATTADGITTLEEEVQLSPRSLPTGREPDEPAAFIEHPAPVPIDESTNPDVIALRAAISVLQIQRDKAKRDIQTLQALKAAAVAAPTGFADDLVTGKLKRSERGKEGLLGPTPSNSGAMAELHQDEASLPTTIPDSQSESLVADFSTDNDHKQQVAPFVGRHLHTLRGEFGQLPRPQNIVRMPPINWDKYHIVGEPLDRMHLEQRRYPGSEATGQASANMFMAPYSPWKDKLEGDPKLEHPMQTRGGSQKPP